MRETYKYPCPFRLHYRCNHTRIMLLTKEDFVNVPHARCVRCSMTVEPPIAASDIAEGGAA